MSGRTEVWMRIVVGVISGIILSLWKMLVVFLTVIHWIYAVFSGKRNKGIAEFANLWVANLYPYYRYMTLTTDIRPFPFSELHKPIHPIEIKAKK